MTHEEKIKYFNDRIDEVMKIKLTKGKNSWRDRGSAGIRLHEEIVQFRDETPGDIPGFEEMARRLMTEVFNLSYPSKENHGELS